MVGVKWVTEKEEMVGLFIGLSWARDLKDDGMETCLGVHALNPQHSNSQEAEAVRSLSSRPANATLQDCVSRNKTKQKDDGKYCYRFRRGKEDSVYS